MRNTIIAIVVGAVLGVGIFLLWRSAQLPPAEKFEERSVVQGEADLKEGEYFDLRGKKEVLISMQRNTFNPQVIVIDKGTKVFWKNEDTAFHYVAIENPARTSKALAKGESYSYVFDTAGSYPYHCGVHEAIMKGLIVVK